MNKKTKKNVQVLFSKVAIKMATKIRNRNQNYVHLELFREEIKTLILLTVLDKTKLVIFNLLLFPLQHIEENLDLVINIILNSSLEEILHKLKATTTVTTGNRSVINSIPLEDSISIFYVILTTVMKENLCENPSRILSFSLETLIIKLTNKITYQLNLIMISMPIFSRRFYKDDAFFESNLGKYLAYDFYIDQFLSSMQMSYNYSYLLCIIDKNGLTTKEIYDTRLCHAWQPLTLRNILLSWFPFIKLIYYVKSLKNFFGDYT